MASIVIMAVGDSITTIVGIYFGKLKNPLNPEKHLEGTVLAIFASTIAAFYIVDFPRAFMASTIRWSSNPSPAVRSTVLSTTTSSSPSSPCCNDSLLSEAEFESVNPVAKRIFVSMDRESLQKLRLNSFMCLVLITTRNLNTPLCTRHQKFLPKKTRLGPKRTPVVITINVTAQRVVICLTSMRIFSHQMLLQIFNSGWIYGKSYQ
jgi:hypothetical protein